MPKNNNLDPVKLPMQLRFGDEPKTVFKNNLTAIKVSLLSAPNDAELKKYLAPFLEATWADDPLAATHMSDAEFDQLFIKCLRGEALPTALETINLVFLLEGISLQEVTHILRYRTASFSAECSGDKWWTDKPALVPWSIQNSDEFHQRYMKLVEDAKKLYCDMIDTKAISIMDARYVLPRCLETFYFMRINLKDAIHFIQQRIDKQIQPETDNILAYQMYIELLKKIPHVAGLVNIHQPSSFYIKMARTGKATNLYFPDSDSDKFEWNEEDFIYQATRSEVCGLDDPSFNLFDEYAKSLEKEIKYYEHLNFEWLRRRAENGHGHKIL